jgi:hypothetical protein
MDASLMGEVARGALEIDNCILDWHKLAVRATLHGAGDPYTSRENDLYILTFGKHARYIRWSVSFFAEPEIDSHLCLIEGQGKPGFSELHRKATVLA